MEPDHLIREYLLLGLRFDRIEEGYVDAFTGDPRLRRQVADESAPDPAGLARQADRLLAGLSGVPRSSDPAAGFTDQRADFIGAHLRALACAGRRFAGEDIGFVDEVRHYFDVEISRGDPDRYRAAHARIGVVETAWSHVSAMANLRRAPQTQWSTAAEEEINAARVALADGDLAGVAQRISRLPTVSQQAMAEWLTTLRSVAEARSALRAG
jgi:hypothetical protein